MRSSWGILEKLLAVAPMYFTAAFILSSGFCSFPSGSPIALAVAGISCISPLAPAQDTAVESKLDSVYARDASRRQSQSISGAYFLNKSS